MEVCQYGACGCEGEDVQVIGIGGEFKKFTVVHGLTIVLNEVIQMILDESLCDVGYRVDRPESGRMKPGAEGNGGGRKRGGAARFSIEFRVPLVVESCCKFNERIMLTKRSDSDIPVVMDMKGVGGKRVGSEIGRFERAKVVLFTITLDLSPELSPVPFFYC